MGKTVIKSERTLLYTNTNSGSGMGEATLLEEDLTRFKYLEVWYNSRNELYYGFKIFKTEIPSTSTEKGIIIAESSRNVIVERAFYISNSKLRTGSGYYYNAFGGTAINNNNFVIPYKIYGIK